MSKRKNPVKDMNLQIDQIIPFSNEHHAGFTIRWSGNIGFGEYTLYRKTMPYDDDPYSQCDEEEKWEAQSEHMDAQDDKDFITELMRLFVESLTITE